MAKKKIHPLEYAILEMFAETDEQKEKLKTVMPYTKEELYRKESNKLKRALRKIYK
jgi:F0F1-type ATP synthase delta subunit